MIIVILLTHEKPTLLIDSNYITVQKCVDVPLNTHSEKGNNIKSASL